MSEDKTMAHKYREQGIDLILTGISSTVTDNPIKQKVIEGALKPILPKLLERLPLGDDWLATFLDEEAREIINGISKGVAESRELRDDGFLDGVNKDSGVAVYFRVLLKVRDEPELEKNKYLKSIFINGAFADETLLSPEELSHLVEITGRLTWRQIRVLALIERGCKKLRDQDYRFDETCNDSLAQLLVQIFELATQGLIFCAKDGERAGKALLGYTDLTPSDLKLDVVGKRLCKYAGLNDIDSSELLDIEIALS